VAMKSIPLEGGEEAQHLNDDEREQLDEQIGERSRVRGRTCLEELSFRPSVHPESIP
jgi:hypothetical protein